MSRSRKAGSFRPPAAFGQRSRGSREAPVSKRRAHRRHLMTWANHANAAEDARGPKCRFGELRGATPLARG
eukprot:scaffold8254_cov229-Pinguiococcus_pyrenoidosus.AAC.1